MNMLYRLLGAGLALSLASAAQAACAGSGAVQICTDQFGNLYTLDQAGNAMALNRPQSKNSSSPDQPSYLLGSITQAYERERRSSSSVARFQSWEGGFESPSFDEPQFADLPSFEGGSH